MKRALILSDDRLGHLNQSLAFVKYLGIPYDVISIQFISKWAKSLSYLLDKMGLYSQNLFYADIPENKYDVIVGTGSSTAYATRVIAKKLKAKSVAMMLPKGYHYDFDFIFAQSHDNPPKRHNIIEVPANFSYVEPKGIYQAQKRSIGIVIGGDNKVFTFSKEKLKEQLDTIVEIYKDHEIAITTSPRTSEEIEQLVASYGFDYEVIFSQDPVNPIPDFLAQCESVFITSDSTSMISEAVSYGKANVVVLPLKTREENKFSRFVDTLEQDGYLHIFDGTIKNRNKKIDFKEYLKEVNL